MHRTTLFYLFGIGLCGAALGCESDPPLMAYRLDGITVFVGFDEPICGGTFDWIEARLRWLAAETGLPASESPILFHWLREETYDSCPPHAGGCVFENRIYSPLEVLSHELVHAHLSRLGSPRPWLAEGMARMLEDTRWDLPMEITAPSSLVAVSKPQQLDYEAAASFVRYLRDRFGMPALLELYAALNDVDAQGTPDVFLAILGVEWDDVEGGYYVTYSPDAVGSINCDFPVLVPEADMWTFPVDSPCDDAATIGPFLGWFESDTPTTERSATFEIEEADIYTVSVSSSANVSVYVLDCDKPLEYFSAYGTQRTEEIELLPGRKRIQIVTDIPDAAVGEVRLRRGPAATPVAPGASHTPGLPRHGRAWRDGADPS